MSSEEQKGTFTKNQQKYGIELVGNMELLRSRGELCDVVLATEGKHFAAHKLVLAASSSFFQSLFTLDMSERKKDEIELSNINARVMAQVLEYMYTGTVSTTLEAHEAMELYIAADYLMLQNLKDITTRMLAQSLLPENCLRTMLWAHRYSSRVLFALAFRFVLDNFRSVSRSEDFLKLPSQELRLFLCSDNLRILDEEDVYKALSRWTEYQPEKRRSFYVEYFSCIRVEYISPFFLKNVVLPDVFRFGDDQLRSDFMETLSSFSEYSQTIINPVRPPRRQVAMVIVVLGQDVYAFCPTTKEWLEMAPVPGWLRIFSTSVMYSGLVYTVGGISDGRNNSCNNVDCFDPVANTWSSKAALPVGTRAAAIAVLDGYLYVIGGRSNNTRFNTVQRYDHVTNSWSLVTSLQETRSGAAAVSFHGNLYAIGGRKNDSTFLNSVERYCPTQNTWSYIAPMNVARASAVAACIRDIIYVIGGVRSAGMSRNSCEVYRVHRKQWDMIAGTMIPRSYAGIATFSDCLFVFGGEDEGRPHDTIEVYDIEKDKWHVLDKMPRTEKFVDCCATFLSKDILPIFSRAK